MTADWVSAIGTSITALTSMLALLFAYLEVRRRQLDERKQLAAGVSASLNLGAERATSERTVFDDVWVTVRNDGTSAVYSIRVVFTLDGCGHVWQADEDVVMPGKAAFATLDRLRDTRPRRELPVAVIFRDARGLWWKRDEEGSLTILPPGYVPPPANL